jgi:hypothetical protein
LNVAPTTIKPKSASLFAENEPESLNPQQRSLAMNREQILSSDTSTQQPAKRSKQPRKTTKTTEATSEKPADSAPRTVNFFRDDEPLFVKHRNTLTVERMRQIVDVLVDFSELDKVEAFIELISSFIAVTWNTSSEEFPDLHQALDEGLHEAFKGTLLYQNALCYYLACEVETADYWESESAMNFETREWVTFYELLMRWNKGRGEFEVLKETGEKGAGRRFRDAQDAGLKPPMPERSNNQ